MKDRRYRVFTSQGCFVIYAQSKLGALIKATKCGKIRRVI